MNLEHQYGDETTLAAVFTRALQHNEPLMVYKQMVTVQSLSAARQQPLTHSPASQLKMYERTKHVDEAETLYGIATRKFPEEAQLWVDWAQHRFKTGDAAGGRELLKTALAALPRREHVATIQQFALLEYRSKGGSVERGRTLFDGIVASYPKRVDVWSVYADQEVSSGDTEGARRVLQRAVASRRSSKKMKFLFKKFAAFEAEHGDEEQQAEVRRAALEYVNSVAAGEA